VNSATGQLHPPPPSKQFNKARLLLLLLLPQINIHMQTP
jgi:hypothetical protein